jgi:twitching motility protein PilT
MHIDQFLKSMVKENVSDLHFKVGSPPKVRLDGELIPVKYKNLTPEDTQSLAFSMMDERQKEFFNKKHELDFSYSLSGVARFRVNVFKQRGAYAIVMRIIPTEIPTIEQLKLPGIIKKIALEPRGMILVTGVTGSGKSTTLAAMINFINSIKKAHIITIEDPIEFVYSDNLSSVNQREIGSDTDSFADALRAALRQDPDVILVGEMRDTETISVAIKAAETGHLVFSTLHTTDAKGTVTRIIDTFPPHQQQQIRYQLSDNIKGVISQRLLPLKDGKGRIVAAEIMVSTPTIRNCIEEPEKTGQIKDIIEAGRSQYKSQSFDQHLTELYKNGLITMEVAVENSTNPSDFQRSLQFD